MDEQGLLNIYSLENIAEAGLMPTEKLVLITSAYYQERQIGVTRLYAAKGAGHRIDGLIRCFNTEVLEGWVVVLDDKQYQVEAAQKVIGKDATDLTLVRLEVDYEIYTEPTNDNE